MIWKVGGREDFSARLENLHRPGDVVVVACTKGNIAGGKNYQLRSIVHDAAQDTLQGKDGVILRRTHPSSWYAKNNRDFEW